MLVRSAAMSRGDGRRGWSKGEAVFGRERHSAATRTLDCCDGSRPLRAEPDGLPPRRQRSERGHQPARGRLDAAPDRRHGSRAKRRRRRGGDPRRPLLARNCLGRGARAAELAPRTATGRPPSRSEPTASTASLFSVRTEPRPTTSRAWSTTPTSASRACTRATTTGPAGPASPPARGARDDSSRVRPPRADPRGGRQEALQARGRGDRCLLRDLGFPPNAVRAYLEELGVPRHDVHYDLSRLRRLAVEAVGALDDAELAALVEAPPEVVPALRGPRPERGSRDRPTLLTTPPPEPLIIPRRSLVSGSCANEPRTLDQAGAEGDPARARPSEAT